MEASLGYLFGICVEKNSEQPLGHPSRKFKGRVVFQGNRVVSQNWQRAIFEDLGNAPATMDASRAADCFGCAPGHTIEMADAEQAYIQVELKGTPCWICVPPDQRPAAWVRLRRLVCRLIKAFYGHPDSGTYWESHCDSSVRKVGFAPAGAGWPSCYIHSALQLFLVVYVDDFKLAGPRKNLAEGWRLLRMHLSIEPAKPIGLYLGCHHVLSTVRHSEGASVVVLQYNMEDFLQ